MLAQQAPHAEVRVDYLGLPLILRIKYFYVGKKMPHLLNSFYTFILIT